MTRDSSGMPDLHSDCSEVYLGHHWIVNLAYYDLGLF